MVKSLTLPITKDLRETGSMYFAIAVDYSNANKSAVDFVLAEFVHPLDRVTAFHVYCLENMHDRELIAETESKIMSYLPSSNYIVRWEPKHTPDTKDQIVEIVNHSTPDIVILSNVSGHSDYHNSTVYHLLHRTLSSIMILISPRPSPRLWVICVDGYMHSHTAVEI